MESSFGTGYAISVWLPPDYTGDLPALYVLDGDEAFNSSAGIALRLISEGQAVPFMVVAVGYEGDNERTRDYTPTVFEGEGGGVITSYSIHYTKLYEMTASRVASSKTT